MGDTVGGTAVGGLVVGDPVGGTAVGGLVVGDPVGGTAVGVGSFVGDPVGGTAVGGLVVMMTGGEFVGTVGGREVVVAVFVGVGTVGVGETGVGELGAPGLNTKVGGKEIFPLGVRYVPAQAIGVRIWGRIG
ncbi:MAG: hypothetical protein Q8L87_01300 [Anaerolineales bacterium]|nr:hypothetical protein [Anaerolineales bacterium]